MSSPDTPLTESAVSESWRPLTIAATAAGVLIAATLVLWAYYGTAVFFELIAAGIAMCL
ncbi:MAG: hypothetical protein IT536_13380 [Hyphomicrobiales bacterium]|nr:hypothetical protein [Hyphomicrobiales bacterium]